MDLPKPWQRKPDGTWRCDASIGWHPDWLGAPVIEMCPNMATETCYNPRSILKWTYLCDDHVEALSRDGRVIRNPRRR